MNKHRTHQIDKRAQRFLCEALPETWVPSKQEDDYAKDYLVEISEENGDLTGKSFFVQLKGQERARFSKDGEWVKFSLESKYASYYSEKVNDLPVLLVVVDINARKGWWLFLQPALESDQSWRRQKQVALRLPTKNDIGDKALLRNAVEEAKKWMRVKHPTSIQEAIIAHKDKIRKTDPRFDVRVSFFDERPHFSLLAKEEVPLQFRFSGQGISQKVSELLDKGVEVTFEPGELHVTGSPLFDRTAQDGCTIQARIEFSGAASFICKDAAGNELGRLSEIPGQFGGGRKELWFDGVLKNSPFSLKLGPIVVGEGGGAKFDMKLHHWDGQRLCELAYFDRLCTFFRAFAKSDSFTIECSRDGNTIFSATMPVQEQRIVIPLSLYLGSLDKARKVAGKFGVNPVWNNASFDKDTRETADDLFAIFFGQGLAKKMPNVNFSAECARGGFSAAVAKRMKRPSGMTLASACTFELLGEKVEVGRLDHEYTDMTVKEIHDHPAIPRGKSKRSKRSDAVKLSFTGAPTTEMRVRQESDVPTQNLPESNLIAEKATITF